jgi:hypothetical protein
MIGRISLSLKSNLKGLLSLENLIIKDSLLTVLTRNLLIAKGMGEATVALTPSMQILTCSTQLCSLTLKLIIFLKTKQLEETAQSLLLIPITLMFYKSQVTLAAIVTLVCMSYKAKSKCSHSFTGLIYRKWRSLKGKEQDRSQKLKCLSNFTVLQ